jgi:hypothetical protein
LGQELDIAFRQAEAAWLDPLLEHASTPFLHTFLPSHDQDHHLRVWQHGKAILLALTPPGSTVDQTLTEGLLIASLFHDLGMLVSIREDHGRLGRENCASWFKVSGRELPERYDEILRAIELHDRKDVRTPGPLQPGSPPDILSILSVADDLEAMGIIGIYRYAEIYLQRGTPMETLGTRILQNAGHRFDNLSLALAHCPDLLNRCQEQYGILRHFYEAYNNQLPACMNAFRESSGPLGVINYIRRVGISEKTLPVHLYERSFAKDSAPELSSYFKQLKDELEQTGK